MDARGASASHAVSALLRHSVSNLHRLCVAELFALLVALFCNASAFVEHEPARASEAAHLPLPWAAWHQCELEGLKSFHGSIIALV